MNGVLKREKVVEALHKMKYGKVPEMDGIKVEFLKNGADSVVHHLLWMFNLCMAQAEMPEGW